MDVMGLISGVTQAVGAYRIAAQTLDEAKITAATNELQVHLMQFGAQVIAMQNESMQASERERATLRQKNELEDRIAELEKRIGERARYELVDVFRGSYAYRLKTPAANGEPIHYICQPCLDNRHMKSVIQRYIQGSRDAKCPSCETMYRFNWFRQ